MTEYLPAISINETQQALTLLHRLVQWVTSYRRTRRREDAAANAAYLAALEALNKAILATRRYLKLRHDGGERSGKTEEQLSRLWQEASWALQPYDREVATLCMVKGHGWADERLWDRAEYRDLPIDVEDMFAELRRMMALDLRSLRRAERERSGHNMAAESAFEPE